MVPKFGENGYLPPGIRPATLDEVEVRFGRQSEVRRAEMQSVRWLVDKCRRDDVERLVLNGSFVTDAAEPNDVDCVLLVGRQFGQREVAVVDWEAGLPFLQIDFVDQTAFDDYVIRVFATGRNGLAKGMIEVTL